MKSFIQGGVTKSPLDKGMTVKPLTDAEIDAVQAKAGIPQAGKKGKLLRVKRI